MNINFNPFPDLSTNRLNLRQFSNSDAGGLFALRSDPQIMKFISRPVAKSIEDASLLIEKFKEGINNNESITWAITLKPDIIVIGTIGFVRMNKENFRAEIGYLLSPYHQGKGIMQEAFTAVTEFGFKSMKLHSIEAKVNPGNTASINLLERNKFIKEGFFKENLYFNGKFIDTLVYSLLTVL